MAAKPSSEPTFVNVNDLRMLNGGHDLDFSSDPHQVLFRFDLGFLDRLDGHLERERPVIMRPLTMVLIHESRRGRLG